MVPLVDPNATLPPDPNPSFFGQEPGLLCNDKGQLRDHCPPPLRLSFPCTLPLLCRTLIMFSKSSVQSLAQFCPYSRPPGHLQSLEAAAVIHHRSALLLLFHPSGSPLATVRTIGYHPAVFHGHKVHSFFFPIHSRPSRLFLNQDNGSPNRPYRISPLPSPSKDETPNFFPDKHSNPRIRFTSP